MGIVSVIAVVAGLAFFLDAYRRIGEIADEQGDEHVSWALRWGARFAALVAVLGAVGLVDSYIYPLPSPFAPGEAELPERHEPAAPTELPEIEPAAKPDPMKDAKEQHDAALDEFTRKAEQE